MKTASRISTVLIFVFLFAPIVILLVFSFNASKSLSVFSGFTLKWYRELLNYATTLGSVRNTLLLAVSAMLVSTVMGTAASVGIHRLRSRALRAALNTVTDIPITNPDIITGISLMLMFVFAGKLFGLSQSLSFWTMLIAHVTFCLPYVILQVLPKLNQMDPALPEAAQLLFGIRDGRLRKHRVPAVQPFLRHVRDMRPVHGDHREVRPEIQALLQRGGRGNAGVRGDEGDLFLGAAEEQGPEHMRIIPGDPGEVFGAVSGSDDDVGQHMIPPSFTGSSGPGIAPDPLFSRFSGRFFLHSSREIIPCGKRG